MRESASSLQLLRRTAAAGRLQLFAYQSAVFSFFYLTTDNWPLTLLNA
jgi:hypothetical protein